MALFHCRVNARRTYLFPTYYHAAYWSLTQLQTSTTDAIHVGF